MSMLNQFKQPVDAAKRDNVLSLAGTVVGQNDTQASNVADASDLATAITLVNAIKDIMIDLGMMAPDP